MWSAITKYKTEIFYIQGECGVTTGWRMYNECAYKGFVMVITMKGVDCRVVAQVNRGAIRVFERVKIVNEDDCEKSA